MKVHLEDPFNDCSISRHLRSRSNDVTAALFDVRTGTTYLYLETAAGWQLNSAGYVHLGRCYDLAVVMSTENPTEQYGLETIGQVGHMFWNFESDLSRQPRH